jgi:prepilin-type N-terminal cleavage/methylation domain-containing protein
LRRALRRAGRQALGWASDERGFTLVELIVVLAVMAILMAALVRPLVDYRARVAERERAANEDAIAKAIRQCYALEGRYPPPEGETGLDYLQQEYGVVVKPDTYRYSYEIVDGAPRLTVEAIEDDE